MNKNILEDYTLSKYPEYKSCKVLNLIENHNGFICRFEMTTLKNEMIIKYMDILKYDINKYFLLRRSEKIRRIKSLIK